MPNADRVIRFIYDMTNFMLLCYYFKLFLNIKPVNPAEMFNAFDLVGWFIKK